MIKLCAAMLVIASCSGPVDGIPCNGVRVDGGLHACPGECDTRLPDGGNPVTDPTNACFNDGDAGAP